MEKNRIDNEFENGIGVIFERLFKRKARFNYYVSGKVVKVNSDGTYDVDINGETSILRAREGLNLSIDSVCYVMVVNGNYSEKFIDCKRP